MGGDHGWLQSAEDTAEEAWHEKEGAPRLQDTAARPEGLRKKTSSLGF